MKHAPIRRLLALLLAALAVVGCSSDGDVAPEDLVIENADLAQNVTEQDLVLARAHFNTARALWEAEGPDAYTMTVDSYATIETTVENGTVLTMEVVRDSGNPREVEVLPQNIKDAFVDIDELISRLEDNPSLILPAGECGNHFDFRFDSETGYPEHYSSLGPCDDGIGVHITVVAGE